MTGRDLTSEEEEAVASLLGREELEREVHIPSIEDAVSIVNLKLREEVRSGEPRRRHQRIGVSFGFGPHDEGAREALERYAEVVRRKYEVEVSYRSAELWIKV